MALKPEDRPEGCKKCWAPGFLSGRGGQTIHGGEDPGKLILWPNRLRKCLTTRKPQRYGWILGEPAEVCRAHPEYMAACVGVALARPDHGFGVPTSDPGAIVEWCKYAMKRLTDGRRLFPDDDDGWMFRQWAYASGRRAGVDGWPENHGGPLPPKNWIWLISASTQQEVNERAPHAAALESMGWRVGLHLEPLLSPIVVPYMMTEPFEPVWSWIVVGAAKGHVPQGGEIGWYHAIRNQCSDQRIPFWLKSPLTLDGVEHRALPEGWPNS